MALITTAPTFTDYFNVGRAEAANRRPDLTFDEGDVSEMYMVGGAAMADHLTGYVAQRVRETFLDGAEGDALSTLADDRYNLQRIDAIKATGVVTFTRSSGALSGTIPAGTVIATTKDSLGAEIQYTTDVNIVWTTETSKTGNACTASIAGVSGNADIAKVNQIVTTGLFDTFSVSNPARFAGGSDAEDDSSLRDRCRSFSTTLRRGTLAALEFGAKNGTGAATASAIEPGDGSVNIYVADASGSSSPTLVSNVATELEKWRAAGILTNVVGGTLDTQAVSLSLTTRSGVNSGAIAAQIQAAVAARINKLKIGETLSTTIIKQAAANVDPDGILDVTVTNPVGNVVPAAGHLIRCGAVTVS